MRDDHRMPPPGGGPRARPFRFATLVALVVALIAAAAAAWAVHSAVNHQEKRLLKERANELNLVLTSSISSPQASLASQGALLTAPEGSRTAYERAAAGAVDQAAQTSRN